MLRGANGLLVLDCRSTVSTKLLSKLEITKTELHSSMLQLWFFDSVVGNHMRAYRRKQNKYGLDNESYHVWGLVELREPCTKVLSPPLSHKLCNFFIIIIISSICSIHFIFWTYFIRNTFKRQYLLTPHLIKYFVFCHRLLKFSSFYSNTALFKHPRLNLQSPWKMVFRNY